jgi:hypothetical protein
LNKNIDKGLFHFCRLLVRIFTPRYNVIRKDKPVLPSVYIVHHQNLWGPIISFGWLDVPARIWVLSVFFSFRECFRQYYDYTFTKRYGVPKFLAGIIVAPLALIVSGIIRAIKAIPVFRGSRKIVDTFKMSMSALEENHNLIICPDIDYTDKSSNVGEIYQGFLHLEKKYREKTGKHVAFVQLRIDMDKHCIIVGDAVYFSDEDSFRNDRTNVYNRLKSHMGASN